MYLEENDNFTELFQIEPVWQLSEHNIKKTLYISVQ